MVPYLLMTCAHLWAVAPATFEHHFVDMDNCKRIILCFTNLVRLCTCQVCWRVQTCPWWYDTFRVERGKKNATMWAGVGWSYRLSTTPDLNFTLQNLKMHLQAEIASLSRTPKPMSVLCRDSDCDCSWRWFVENFCKGSCLSWTWHSHSLCSTDGASNGV